MSSEDELAREVLVTEYSMLMSALNAAWSASLTRTSLFLGVLSAAGVAFGFASQGGVEQAHVPRPGLAGLRTRAFPRDRHLHPAGASAAGVDGLYHRHEQDRHFFAEAAPSSRPYFVLPIYDDGPALYRSIGTGMGLRRPRFELLHLTVQTQGIVGIVTAVVAAGCGALAASSAGGAAAWIVAIAAFSITMIGLFVYWQRFWPASAPRFVRSTPLRLSSSVRRSDGSSLPSRAAPLVKDLHLVGIVPVGRPGRPRIRRQSSGGQSRQQQTPAVVATVGQGLA